MKCLSNKPCPLFLGNRNVIATFSHTYRAGHRDQVSWFLCGSVCPVQFSEVIVYQIVTVCKTLCTQGLHLIHSECLVCKYSIDI